MVVMNSIFGFSKVEEAAILLASTVLFSLLFFRYEEIDKSNIFTMFIELGFAGLVGFILARYYFNKDRDLQTREKNEKEEKLRNKFAYSLRTAHVAMSQEITMMGKGILPQFSIQTLIDLLGDVIFAFKNYDPTDIDSDKMLKNTSMLVEKHKETIMTDVFFLDLKSSLSIIEQLGKKYHIDLTPI